MLGEPKYSQNTNELRLTTARTLKPLLVLSSNLFKTHEVQQKPEQLTSAIININSLNSVLMHNFSNSFLYGVNVFPQNLGVTHYQVLAPPHMAMISSLSEL